MADVIEDPKPKGSGQALSRHLHELTAERLMDRYYTKGGGHTLHLIQNAFYYWNGSHYVEKEHHWAGLRVTKMLNAGKVLKSYEYTDADGREHKGEKLVPYAPLNEHISNTLNQLRAATYVDPVISPCWLPGASRDVPPAEEIAPVANGLLHMPTGQLLPPTPLFFCTRASSVAYDPDAIECPEWDRFMTWVFGDDLESWHTQEEMMAYCMVGGNKHQKVFNLNSPGRGGKGTRMDVLGALLSPGAVVGCDVLDFGANNGTNLHKLIDAAVMHFEEPSFKGADRNGFAAKIKAITGGSRQSISRKFKGQWQGKIGAVPIFTGNEGLDFHDSSDVIGNRTVDIRSEATLIGSPNKVERDYFGRYLAAEMPAIMHRMVVAHRRLEDRGEFMVPRAGLHLKQMASMNAAPVKDFLLSDYWERDAGFRVTLAKAYDMYRMYTANMGRAGAGNQASFGKDVNNANVPNVKARQLDEGVYDPSKPKERMRIVEGLRPSLRYDAERREKEAANVAWMGDVKKAAE